MASKSHINTEFYNENTIELELKGSDFNGAFIWWRRGESNPCPKNIPIRFLRVQTVFDNAYDAKKPTKAASMRSFYPRLL